MAWVVGDTVTPTQKATGVNVLGAFMQIGRVVSVAGACEVLWEDGSSVKLTDDSQLDKVSGATAADIGKYLGREVQLASASVGNYGQWNKGRCVLVYQRVLSGGSATPSGLILTDSGVYVDVSLSQMQTLG